MSEAMLTAPTVILGSNRLSTKPDKMVTLVCSSCRMALYMADRKLQEASWKCPSCGLITRT